MSRKGKVNLVENEDFEDLSLGELIEEALRVNDLELVKMMISRGADKDQILYRAVQHDSDDIVDFLPRQPGIDVNYEDNDLDRTTLQASFKYVKNTKKLLQQPELFLTFYGRFDHR